MAAALLRLAWCASTATALFVHPGAGNTATLKPPVIDPFNPFGTPAEDPMHGHSVAASHLTTDHLDVLARLVTSADSFSETAQAPLCCVCKWQI